MEKSKTVMAREKKIMEFLTELRESCDNETRFFITDVTKRLGLNARIGREIVQYFTNSTTARNKRRWIGGRSITNEQIAETYGSFNRDVKHVSLEKEYPCETEMVKGPEPDNTYTDVMAPAKVVVYLSETTANGDINTTTMAISATFNEVKQIIGNLNRA